MTPFEIVANVIIAIIALGLLQLIEWANRNNPQ